MFQAAPDDIYDRIIFPLVVADAEGGEWSILSVAGTAFVASGVVLTCWHQVQEASIEGRSAGIVQWQADVPHFLPLEFDRLEPHDLGAAAAPEALPRAARLQEGPLPNEGADVYSYGYPLPEGKRDWIGERFSFTVTRRLLRGYVMRGTIAKDVPHVPDGGVMLELDMQAPPGLSGAPVMVRHGGAPDEVVVVGVVKGTHLVKQGEDEARFTWAYASAQILDLVADLRSW